MDIAALRAALSGASLLLSACAPDGAFERAPVAIGPRGAGLLALDALAPAFGGAARQSEEDCAMRYAIEALITRCVALKGDGAAFVSEMPRLRALAAAMAEAGVATEEARFLSAMDALFDPLAGRAAPQRGAAARDFAAAEQRLAALLAEEGPGWGAGSFAAVMDAGGRPLNAEEAAGLGLRLKAAEAARANWRTVKMRLSAALRALDAYEAALAAKETGE